MLQFEAKTYKNQRKGFTEVTGSFQYKFPDYKSPQDDLLSLLISKKKKKNSQSKFFFSKLMSIFNPIFHVYTLRKHQKT